MRQPDRRGDVGAGGQDHPVRAQLARQASAGQRDHRAQAQGLGDDRAQVGVVAGVELAREAREHVGVAGEQVERPRERGRRRLVAREQERHQLVADLAVLHPTAVLEAGGDQQRADVVARGRRLVRRPGARRSPRAGSRRSRAMSACSLASGSGPPSRRDSRTENCRPADAVEPSSSTSSVAKARAARGVGDAEDRAQDDLEGDGLHAGVRRERPVRRPARDLALGRLADDRLVGAHAVAVERRQHDPPA